MTKLKFLVTSLLLSLVAILGFSIKVSAAENTYPDLDVNYMTYDNEKWVNITYLYNLKIRLNYNIDLLVNNLDGLKNYIINNNNGTSTSNNEIHTYKLKEVLGVYSYSSSGSGITKNGSYVDLQYNCRYNYICSSSTGFNNLSYDNKFRLYESYEYYSNNSTIDSYLYIKYSDYKNLYYDVKLDSFEEIYNQGFNDGASSMLSTQFNGLFAYIDYVTIACNSQSYVNENNTSKLSLTWLVNNKFIDYSTFKVMELINHCNFNNGYIDLEIQFKPNTPMTLFDIVLNESYYIEIWDYREDKSTCEHVSINTQDKETNITYSTIYKENRKMSDFIDYMYFECMSGEQFGNIYVNSSYSIGYNNGVHDGYNKGFYVGYDNGYDVGNYDGFNDGFLEGKDNANEEKYNQGYQVGFNDGAASTYEDAKILSGFIPSIFTGIASFIITLSDGLSFFGMSVTDFILGLGAVCVVMYLIKEFL